MVARRSSGRGLLPGNEGTDQRHDLGPGRSDTSGEPLLEADVLGIAEVAIGTDGRRVVRPDVEDDMVARLEQLGRDGSGHRRGVPAAAVVAVGEHVAHHREPGGGADHVRPGGRHELALDAEAEVAPFAEGRRRQPRPEAELVEAIELHRVVWPEPLEAGVVGRAESGPVHPHPDHLRTGVEAVPSLDRRDRNGERRDVRDPGPDDVAEDGHDALVSADGEERLRGSARVFEHDRDDRSAGPGRTPARAREFAVVEVADRVGRVDAIPLEEGAQERAVGGHGRGHARLAARDRDRRHWLVPADSASAAGSGDAAGPGGTTASAAGDAAGAGGTTASATATSEPRRAVRRAIAASSAGPYGARRTPSSVTIPVISAAGVTSNDGLRTAVPSGAMRCPRTSVTSSADRSSIGIPDPSGVARSTDDSGAHT